MRAISMALEGYAVDHNTYPLVANGKASSLAEKLEPTYIKRLPLKDDWGNDFYYYCKDATEGYWIISFGEDGKPEKEIYDANGIPNKKAEGVINSPDMDLILRNGGFIRSNDLAELQQRGQADTSRQESIEIPETPSEGDPVSKGDKYFHLQMFDAAIKEYEAAIKLDPKSRSKVTDRLVKAFYNLGLISLREKDCNRAKDTFARARFLNDSDKLSNEGFDIASRCIAGGYDSIMKSVVFLELRKIE